eukprot:Polyplicarium_translucidae@DN3140_c0_g1_i4.p1
MMAKYCDVPLRWLPAELQEEDFTVQIGGVAYGSRMTWAVPEPEETLDQRLGTALGAAPTQYSEEANLLTEERLLDAMAEQRMARKGLQNDAFDLVLHRCTEEEESEMLRVHVELSQAEPIRMDVEDFLFSQSPPASLARSLFALKSRSTGAWHSVRQRSGHAGSPKGGLVAARSFPSFRTFGTVSTGLGTHSPSCEADTETVTLLEFLHGHRRLQTAIQGLNRRRTDCHRMLRLVEKQQKAANSDGEPCRQRGRRPSLSIDRMRWLLRDGRARVASASAETQLLASLSSSLHLRVTQMSQWLRKVQSELTNGAPGSSAAETERQLVTSLDELRQRRTKMIADLNHIFPICRSGMSSVPGIPATFTIGRHVAFRLPDSEGGTTNEGDAPAGHVSAAWSLFSQLAENIGISAAPQAAVDDPRSSEPNSAGALSLLGHCNAMMAKYCDVPLRWLPAELQEEDFTVQIGGVAYGSRMTWAVPEPEETLDQRLGTALGAAPTQYEEANLLTEERLLDAMMH